jgi:hypothetical protein
VVQEAEYDISSKVGEVEIRRYRPIVLATVRGYSDNEAFSLLFDYISGRNRASRKIAMTAPVITSEKIPMTVPVVSGRGSFSFVLPADMTIDSAPVPADSRVVLEAFPERSVAVIRFRGRASRRQVESVTEELRGALAKSNRQPRGESFLMRYNPPITPGFLRRNEVGIEIDG